MRNPKTSTPALLAVVIIIITGLTIILKILTVDEALRYAGGIGLFLTTWGLFKAKDGGL